MDLMERFVGVVDDIVAADPAYLADGGHLREFNQQMTRLLGVQIRSIGEFDQWDAGAADGAKNSADWISTEFKEPVKESRRRIKHARALRNLPIVAEALMEGKINEAHLDLFVAVHNSPIKDALTKDQELLVDQAATKNFGEFHQDLEYYKQSVDPEGAEANAAAQRDRRAVYLAPVSDGMHVGRISLDPISGTIVANELDRLESELFDADWAEAKARLGRDPRVDELSRTPAQRRADALVEMAVRSRTAPAGGRRPEPRFSVLIGYDKLHDHICELENGIVVTPGTVYEWLDRAYFERVVFQPNGRVEVSETARFFTGATRRAIEIRDRRCTHPFCNEPVERCQGDHIQEWSKDGKTTQENGQLLCSFHNRLRNQRPPPDD